MTLSILHTARTLLIAELHVVIFAADWALRVMEKTQVKQ